MRRLNRLRLGPGLPGPNSHWQRKELLIDDRPLQEHLAGVTPSAADWVSPFGWTSLEFERGYRAQLLLAAPSPLPSGRQLLLVCPCCANSGCGCISARVEIDAGRVFWSEIGFENDYDPDSLTIYPFYSFTFDVDAYRTALAG